MVNDCRALLADHNYGRLAAPTAMNRTLTVGADDPVRPCRTIQLCTTRPRSICRFIGKPPKKFPKFEKIMIDKSDFHR